MAPGENIEAEGQRPKPSQGNRPEGGEVFHAACSQEAEFQQDRVERPARPDQ